MTDQQAAHGHVVDQVLPQRADGLRRHWTLLLAWVRNRTLQVSSQKVSQRDCAARDYTSQKDRASAIPAASGRGVIRKLGKIITPICASLFATACAHGEGEVPLSFPVDVAHAGKQACTEFSVSKERTYQFSLEIHFNNIEEKHRLFALLGNQGIPGLMIPVGLELSGFSPSGEGWTKIYEMEKNSTGHDIDAYSGGAEGNMSRLVAWKKLGIGKYRLCETSLADVPELYPFATRILISWYWNAG